MKKQRKTATILKPVIDEEAALRFASAGSGPTTEPSTEKSPKSASKPASQKVPDDMRLISFAIKKDLYEAIAEEAAGKNRTIEEHLRKHLTKRYAK